MGWEYRNALFEAESHPGRIVAEWLRRGSVPMQPHRFKLQLMGPSNVFRHASGAPSGGYEKLGWPCLEVAFAVSSNTQAIDGPLVADDAPPFVSYGLAATAFFGLTADIGRAPETMQSVFRRQDLTGRVVRVTIRAADVTVELEGPRIAGAFLNLAGPTYSIRKRLGRNGFGSSSFRCRRRSQMDRGWCSIAQENGSTGAISPGRIQLRPNPVSRSSSSRRQSSKVLSLGAKGRLSSSSGSYHRSAKRMSETC